MLKRVLLRERLVHWNEWNRIGDLITIERIITQIECLAEDDEEDRIAFTETQSETAWSYTDGHNIRISEVFTEGPAEMTAVLLVHEALHIMIGPTSKTRVGGIPCNFWSTYVWHRVAYLRWAEYLTWKHSFQVQITTPKHFLESMNNFLDQMDAMTRLGHVQEDPNAFLTDH